MFNGTTKLSVHDYEENLYHLMNSVELILQFPFADDLWWMNSPKIDDYQQAFYFIVANFVSLTNKGLQNQLDPIIDSIKNAIEVNFIWIYVFTVVQVVLMSIESVSIMPTVWKVTGYMAKIMNSFAKVTPSDLEYLIYRTETFLDKCSEKNRENGVMVMVDEQEDDNYIDSEEDYENRGENIEFSADRNLKDNRIVFIDENMPFNYRVPEAKFDGTSPNRVDSVNVAVHAKAKEFHVFDGTMSPNMIGSSKNFSQILDHMEANLNSNNLRERSPNKSKMSMFHVEARKRSKLIKLRGKKGFSGYLAKQGSSTPQSGKFDATLAKDSSLHAIESHLGRAYGLKAFKVITGAWLVTALCVGGLVFLDYMSFISSHFALAHIRSLEDISRHLSSVNALCLRTVSLGSLQEADPGTVLYEKADKSREMMKGISAQAVPSLAEPAIARYFGHFKTVMDISLCDPAVANISDAYTMADCQDDVGMKHGVQTAVVRFNELVEIIAKNADDSKSREQVMLATAESVSELGNLLFTSEDINEKLGFAFKALSAEFMAAIESASTNRASIKVTVLMVVFLIFSNIFYFTRHRYYQNLSNEIFLTRSMTNFLPYDTVIATESLYRDIIALVHH